MLATLRRTLSLGAMLVLAGCSGTSTPPPAVPRVDEARSTLTAAPSSATADGLDAVTLTATARDASGAPLSGRVATFAVTGASTLSSATATTHADGAAAVTLTSTAAGQKDVSVSIDGVAVTAHATATFVAGPAASLAFAVQPSNVVAGALIAPAVRVAVADAFGNAVTAPTEITLGLTGGPTGAGIFGTLGAVATGGSADFADLSVRAAGTGYALTASSTGLTDATSDTFSVSPAAPDASTSDVAADPTSLAAGDTSALTATVRDAFGNPVPGATVAFEATGTGNTISNPSATDVSGAAVGTLSSTKAEAKTVTAKIGALALTDRPIVTFTAGAPDPARSSLVASPTSAPDDGTQIALTVTVRDAYGNPVVGETVTFSSSGNADFTQPSTVTAADGTATGAVSASAAGAQTIHAHVGVVLVAQADVTFTAVPSAAASTVEVAPSSVPADGTTAAAITVTVKEALGQPVGRRSALSGTATSRRHRAARRRAGAASFSVKSSTPGTGALTATVNPGAGQTALAQRPTLEFVAPTYAIGGLVHRLTASGLVLATAGQSDLAVPASATAFAFAEKVPSGTDYAVTVKTQPAGQTCTVVNGTGTVANSDVNGVVVECGLPPLTWTWVPIEGSVCSDGSPTGIGIEVGPGASPNVLVFLDGGGACWDYFTCWQYRTASSGPFGAAEFATRIAAARAGGVLDRTLPGNPYADDTFVFVPYCTGDVHSGATTMTYPPATQAWHHNGRANVSNAFAYLAAALDAPARVVVSGSSAGGSGRSTRSRGRRPRGRARRATSSTTRGRRSPTSPPPPSPRGTPDGTSAPPSPTSAAHPARPTPRRSPP
jgi:adhesin/invasin